MSDPKPRRSRSGLAASATRGAAVTLVGQLLRIVLQLAGIVLLARLLDPASYGLMAMVLAIIGVGDLLRDFGLSSAAIQAREVLPAQRTNLFWINTGIGAVLALAVLGASWPIAALYGDDRLQPLTAVLSVTLLLNGAATQFRADLNRNLRFGRLAVADISGQLLGLTAALTAAVSGWGYWALAVQQVVPVVVQLVVVVSVTRWLPGLPRRGVPMREFLSFGSSLAATQVLTYASRNVDSVVLGATVGAQPLGLYNRAFNLMTLPLNQMQAPSTRVALPVLSRLQDDPRRFAEFLRTGQTLLLNAAAAVIGLSAAQAPAVIAIALGPKWAAAAPIYQVLAFGGIFTALGYACWWVYLSKGLTGLSLRLSLVTRPLMVGLILIGSLWGVTGVAVAYATGCALVWPANLFWLHRKSDAPVRMIFMNGLRTVLVFGTAAVISWASTLWVGADQPWVSLVVGTVSFAACIALAWVIVPAYRGDVRAMLRIRGQIRSRSVPGRSPELEKQI